MREVKSKNAELLKDKIKQVLDIDVEPIIYVTATKGFMSGGCAVFMMMNKRKQDYLFPNTVKEVLKSKTLSLYVDPHGSHWIETT